VNEPSDTGVWEEKMGKEIRIIKKDDQKKFEDHTFIDNNIELKKLGNEMIAILLLPMTKSIESMYLN
jgi:hypothetical protein